MRDGQEAAKARKVAGLQKLKVDDALWSLAFTFNPQKILEHIGETPIEICLRDVLFVGEAPIRITPQGW